MSARLSEVIIDQKRGYVFREGTGHLFEPSAPRDGTLFLKREFWMNIFKERAIFASSASTF